MKLITPALNPNADILNIVLVPSSECNLRCSYCYMKEQGYEKKFNPEIFNKIIDIINELPKTEIDFLGGEPTIIPGFLDYISRIKMDKDYFSLMVFTNGTRPEIVKELKDPIRVSISYHTDYHCESYLKDFIEMVQKPNVWVNLVVTEKNYKIIEEVVSRLKPYTSNFKFIREKFNNFDMEFVGTCEYEIDEIEMLCDGVPMTLEEKRKRFVENPNFYGCLCRLNVIFIMYDGEIYYNCIKERIGNIMDSNSKDYFKIKTVLCPHMRCKDCFHNVPRYVK